jgi:hypothetical protein
MLHILNSKVRSSGKKTVVVFGCGRGGTSAVAGVLRELGVLFSPATHPLKHESSPVRYIDDQVDRAATQFAIAEMNKSGETWGWKSPRDLFSFPGWISLVDNPHFVVVFRNPSATIDSIIRHDDIDFPVAALHVGEVQYELARFIAFSPLPLAVVSYEELCKSPEDHIRIIADWLYSEIPPNNIRNAVEFVSPESGGYRSLTTEPVATADNFSVDELTIDRNRSQLSAYCQVNEKIRENIINLTQDLTIANAVVENLTAIVGELEDKVLTELLKSGTNVSVQDYLTHVAEKSESRCPLLTKSDQYRQDAEKIPDNDKGDERSAVVAKEAWAALSNEFAAVSTARMEIQRQMDDLSVVRDRLSDALLSIRCRNPSL